MIFAKSSYERPVGFACAVDDAAGDSGLAYLGDDLFPLVIEAGVLKVIMTIEKHHHPLEGSLIW